MFDALVPRCDFGIDLHTAAVCRTNYPSVRANLDNPDTCRIATSSGCEVIMNGRGPKGVFRRAACRAGCPTLVMEGGDVWKAEPTIVGAAMRGVKNVLRELEVLDGPLERPQYQILVEKSSWVRAERGGFLHFPIQPGDLVERDQPVATNTTLPGHEKNVPLAPFAGVVPGMSPLPAVSPGEPVCHIGKLPEGTTPDSIRHRRRRDDGFEGQILDDLASNVRVVRPQPSTPSPTAGT